VSRGKRITARGCLQEAGADLYLIQDDGTRVEVTGAKLDEYKGHEAEVGGERRSRTIAISVSGAASSAALRPVITVKSFKDLGPNWSKTSN